MKAPDKLYFLPDDALFDIFNVKESDEEVEYIRTDAFIEKAQDFFRQSHHLFSLDGNEIDHFIEGFKNYIKK